MPIKASGPIADLQRALSILSNTNQSIPKLAADGIFDQSTKNAVLAFQRLAGINPTGEVDLQTWEALFEEARIEEERIKDAERLIIFKNPADEIKFSDSGEQVFFLQTLLWALSNTYSNLLNVDITGIYDQKTKDSVENFQRLNNLSITGNVTKQTWDSIAKTYNAL